MVLGMLFENFKNYYILRYAIFEFLKKVLGVPQPTCLVRVFSAASQHTPGNPRHLHQWMQSRDFPGSHNPTFPGS